MKRKALAILVALCSISLLMDVTYLFYNTFNVPEGSQDSKNISENVKSPDEVVLAINHSLEFVTYEVYTFILEGEPFKSNITWLIDNETIGFGDEVDHYFYESKYYKLIAIVIWSDYTKNISENIAVKNEDWIRKFSCMDTEPMIAWDLCDFASFLRVDPGLTEPICWMNLTLGEGKGILDYWVRMKEENKIECSEVLYHIQWNLSWGNFSKSIYYDNSFFLEHQEEETYFIRTDLILDDEPSSFVHFAFYSIVDY